MEKEIELLNKISNADELEFKYFFDKYVKRVYQFVFNFIRDKAESEDITQLVFIKIWKNKTNINEIKSLDGYVFTVANRLIIDYYRSSETKFKKQVSIVHDSEIQLSINSVEDTVNEHHFETMYKKALNFLPPKRREIFILSRHTGLTNKQIAQKLHISNKTVENQMTAALSALKRYLIGSDFSIVMVFGIFIFH